ncbi:hypothetical protein C8K30_104411 [Promicromonospora sp. AC04]|uniref:hypothetical protein n=1 Tax=Promicromonospora sp. AC04 TaxID=2135723 RepID=UPI000D40DDAC|nr:hypothetical protein [Promicromonospora sp. AC04]PUB27958.1 hypothetical protein C8K30_104411 [Promicromonospora sp. AC04]
MSDQQPAPYPARTPGAPQAYVAPQAPAVSAGYRRWANILVWVAAVIAALVVVGFVASFVLLAQADAGGGSGALGYLAIFIWFGIVAAIPVLLAVGIPGLVMKLRVRRQAQAFDGGAGARP